MCVSDREREPERERERERGRDRERVSQREINERKWEKSKFIQTHLKIFFIKSTLFLSR